MNQSKTPAVASTESVSESRREVPSRRAASISSAKILAQTAAGDAPMEVDDSEDRPQAVPSNKRQAVQSASFP